VPHPLMMPSQAGAPPPLSSVRHAIKQSLFAVGYYHQRLSHAAFPGVAVLCYHGVRKRGEATPFGDLHVTSATFERHCRLLADACQPISLADFRDARNGRRALPPRPVLVTFDDGYRGVVDHALPLLERYGIPAILFACVQPVLERRHFWFDALWRRDGEAAVLKARALPFHEWRTLVDSIDTAADIADSHRPLTTGELQHLAGSPLIEIGGHTMTHPTLALAPVDEQRREIAGCRAALKGVLGKPIAAFAYPYGSPSEDYTSETVAVVRDAGFDIAFTTDASFATTRCDPFQIPRFIMLDTVSEVELAHRLVHSWHGSVS
jgi:peptidoglycan/xylan/chitin deacetylase (PgdA/CDA1 family)